MSDHPLDGLRVVSLAINLPGPAAAARLATLGADVIKVEPPTSDPLAFAAPDYYRQLVDGQQVVELDLKDESAREHLWQILDTADLLLTSSRPSALDRLGLGWDFVHERRPRLSQVAIVGHAGAAAEIAGHDLTYQASVGTLRPPQMPTVLVADLAGAERAAAEGVAAMLAAHRTGVGVLREVALSDVAEDMAQPAVHGLTTPDGFLGGALPQYAIYSAADGFVAVAAIEGHFWRSLTQLLEIAGTRAELEAVFLLRTAGEWDAWGREHGLPVAGVRSPGQGARHGSHHTTEPDTQDR